MRKTTKLLEHRKAFNTTLFKKLNRGTPGKLGQILFEHQTKGHRKKLKDIYVYIIMYILIGNQQLNLFIDVKYSFKTILYRNNI